MRISKGCLPASAGFAYLALLLFVAVLGAATAAAVQTGALAERRWVEAQLLFVGAQYQEAFASYYRATPAGQPSYPNRIDDLLHDPRFPGIRRHLRRPYADPLTGAQDWVLLPAPGGGIMGLHSRIDRQPFKTQRFAAPFEAFENRQRYSDWVFAYPPMSMP